MAGQLNLSWKIIKPHIPLIKFRNGSLQRLGEIALTPLGEDEIVVPLRQASPSVPRVKGQHAVLEEWQVPASYRRPQFTEEEIEYINRGGPA